MHRYEYQHRELQRQVSMDQVFRTEPNVATLLRYLWDEIKFLQIRVIQLQDEIESRYIKN